MMHLVSSVWTFLLAGSSAQAIDVFWNVPTEECPRDIEFNLIKFNIIQNKGGSFSGERFTTLYRPGHWPQMLQNNTKVNGAIPSNGNLKLHLKRLKRDIENSIRPDYKGPAVIDFEQWMPTLRSTGEVKYRKLAKDEFLRQRELGAWGRLDPSDTVDSLFERFSRLFLEETLKVAREVRPNALWGYYHYPYCKNYVPHVEYCAPAISEDNTKAQWLYNNSRALYPSVYLRRDYSAWENNVQTRVILDETERLAKAAGGRPVFPFTWYNYHKASVIEYLGPADLMATIGQVMTRRPAGLAIWGGSSSVATPQLCRRLHRYVTTRLGPFVRFMTGLSPARLDMIGRHLSAGPGSFIAQVALLAHEGAFGEWQPLDWDERTGQPHLRKSEQIRDDITLYETGDGSRTHQSHAGSLGKRKLATSNLKQIEELDCKWVHGQPTGSIC